MRTIFVRSLQSVLTFAAVALLTGANDAGCGLGTVIGGEGSGGNDTSSVSAGSGTVDPTGPISCPSGMVLQLVCNAGPSGGGGIPIEPCTGPSCPPPPPDCDPADGNCSPPYPGDDDVPQPPPCDPADPSCSSPPPPCDPADPDCSSPPPPCDPADPSCSSPYPGNPLPWPCDPADPNCISPMPCEPGGAECPPPPPPPPGCSYECVPGGQVCPPGTDLMTVCADGGSGSEGTAGGSPSIPPGGPDTPVSNVVCWTECMPHGCGGEEPGGPPQPEPQPVPQPAPQPD